MALELSALKFAVDTTELDRAGKAIGELVTNVGKLDKAARDAAQTEATLARAAKDSAKANLDNAKAQDVRLKSTITADKADQQATAAIEKKTKATEKVNEVVNKNVGVLQRQKDILEFQTQGFSKGQSSILAYGKAAGLAAEDIGELGKVLETQRKLMGGDPFDKSLSGLKSLQNQYTELKESVRQYATDSNLTAKQTRELARDKERLIEKMKVEGASFSEIRKAVRAHNADYVNLATSYNKMTSAEDAVIKSRKEAVNATNYLTQADQKMAAALNTSNAALDKAGTDSLVKYETALRKSGVSQDVATLKLAKYKAQLEQVQIQEQKRREQHLTRALAPQATDVVVSLWSGQNPLTVLLQQGGQVTDLFMQSGVAAETFGEVVKSSMQSMLPSILAVVKGVGGLLVDGLIAAGNATQGFIAGIFGMTGAMDKLYMKLSENGPSKFGGMIQAASSIMTGVFAVGVGVVIAGLAMMAKGAYDSMIAVSDLNKAMVLGGNAFNMTGAQALAYADTLSGANVSTLGIIEVMTEMSKVGGFTADQIALVSKAAISMQDYAGVAIKDTVKQFSELGKDPVKALLELAKKTGELTVEQIKSVEQLQKQGRVQDAVNLAMKISAGVMDKQSQSLRDQLHPLEKLVAGWKILGRWMWNVTNIAPGTSDALELINKKERLAKSLAAGVSENVPENVALKQEIALLEAKTLTQAQSAANRQAVKDEAAAYQQYSGALSEFDKQLNKADASKMKRQDFINAKIQELGVLENAGKYESTTLSVDRIKQFFKVYGEEWDKANKGAGKEAARDLDHYADILNKVNGLSSSYNNELATLQKLRSQGKITEEQYVQAVEDLIKLQPFYTKQQNEINDAHELSNRLLGQQDMLGKDYYKKLEQIDKYQKMGVENGGYSVEQAEKLRQAAFDQTELAKTRLKIEEDSYKIVEKYRDENEKSLNSTVLENAKLDDRLALLGLTSEQQKYLRIEQERRNKLLAIDLKLQTQIQDVWDKWGSGGFGQGGATKAKAVIIDLEKAAAEDRKTINREVAVQAAEDYDAEFKKIKSTVSESIAAALFDGGKAGSSKIKDYLKTELRKRITLSIDVFINPIMGTVAGALGFGGGSSASASNGGGNVFGVISNGFSALNGGIATGISNAFSKFAGSSVGQSLGLSNSTAIVGNNPSAYVPEGGQLTSLGQSIGTAAGMIGSGLAGYGISSAISGGYTTGGNTVNVLAGVSSAFLGPIAGVIGGAVNRAFGRKLADSGIQGSFGTQSGFSGESYQFYKGGWFRSDKTKTSEMDAALAKTLGTAFTQMITQVGTLGTVLGLSTDSLKDFNTTFKLSFQGLQESEIQGKIQEALATANNEMAEQILGTWSKTTKEVTDVIEWRSGTGEGEFVSTFENITRVVEEVSYTASSFAREGEKAIDTLTRLATSITLVNSTFEGLGYSLYEASLQGGDFASKLIDLFGGNDNFAALTTSYYENFYSEQEKTALLTKQLTKEFGKFNEAMPTTKAEFKAIVDKQDLLTDSGRESFAKLLGLQTPLLNLFDLLEKAAGDAALAETMKSLKEEANSLEIELLRLQGKTPEADARQKATDTAGMTEAEQAAYDYNKSLQATLDATRKAAERSEQERQTLLKMQKDQDALWADLAEAQGDSATAAQRRYWIETAGMTEAEQAAYDYNKSLKEQITALQRLSQLQQQSTSLEIELLRLQGKTAEADAKQRAIDTAGMSEAEIAVYNYNAALREQIANLNASSRAISDLADEINRLRGYTDTSGNSPQALISEFDRLTTLARGGDAEAFNSLGDTSKLLDEYYKNTATSAVQYAYQRSVLANSLEQSYNTAKASGATFSGTSSLMGTPALSAPVVSSVSSANAAGSSGIASLLTDLITEVSMLRAEVRADVAHNAKTAKILERVTPEGDALATRNEG